MFDETTIKNIRYSKVIEVDSAKSVKFCRFYEDTTFKDVVDIGNFNLSDSIISFPFHDGYPTPPIQQFDWKILINEVDKKVLYNIFIGNGYILKRKLFLKRL